MAKYEIVNGVGIIPEGTTIIEKKAFLNAKELTSIVIPDTVKEIRVSAFEGCINLTSIKSTGTNFFKRIWKLNGRKITTSFKCSESYLRYSIRDYYNC